MNLLIRTGRAFFALGIIGLAVQQFQYGALRPVIFPEWPAGWQNAHAAASIVAFVMVIASLLILTGRNGEKASLLLAGFFLLLFIAFHFIFLVFFNPNSFHLGSWTNALKILALSGGAFVMAASFREQYPSPDHKSTFTAAFGKLIPAGRIFFSVMLIAFGIDHFLYTDFVAALVPNWIPGHIFWTYFAAVALIGSGLGILFKIQLKTVALLTAAMLFIWLIVLHIPRGVEAGAEDKGNEVTSVFEALNFAGIALVMAGVKKSSI
jgi:uncharacterized membrane protein YphA (DoxX/SURF4 family)